MTDVTLDATTIRPLPGALIRPKTYGETSGYVGEIVYFYDDDTVKNTDADTAGTLTGRVGMIVSGGRHEADGSLILGERVDVLEWGPVEVGPDAALDVTKQYFASGTKGKMADAAGTVTRRLGAPESSHVFFFNPDATPATSS